MLRRDIIIHHGYNNNIFFDKGTVSLSRKALFTTNPARIEAEGTRAALGEIAPEAVRMEP